MQRRTEITEWQKRQILRLRELSTMSFYDALLTNMHFPHFYAIIQQGVTQMPTELFEKKAEFISWCIEQYAAEKGLHGRDVANDFSQKKVLDFLDKHYEILHTQGKSYILETIDDFIKTGATA